MKERLKNIPKTCWVLAGLLIIWAAVDFYHYFKTGRGLVEMYPERDIIRRLVEDLTLQGIVKLVIAGLIMAIGFWRSGNKNIRASSAVTLLLAGAMLLSWAIGMYCATSVTAEFAADRFLDANGGRAGDLNYRLYYSTDHSDTRQNYWLNMMWEQLGAGAASYSTSYTVMDSGDFIKRRNESESYFAAAFYDAQGAPLAVSWKDYISFEFLTEEQWAGREERSSNNAIACFDPGKLTAEGQALIGHGVSSAEALRLTGWFDGVELVPEKIEYVDRESFSQALWSQGSGSYTVSGIIQDHELTWLTAYEDPEVTTDIGERVIFYSDWFNISCYEPSPALSHLGTEYVNLAALVKNVGPQYTDGQQRTRSWWFDGLDLILMDAEYLTLINGEPTRLDFHPNSFEFEAGTTVETKHYVVTAVMFSPWHTAFYELRDVYIITFLLTAALVLVLRYVLCRHLVAPLKDINSWFETEDNHSYILRNNMPGWNETRELYEHCAANSDRQRKAQNEITRLNTALEYSKTAEASRRQMTSNIAHELKTPLAVIHSYAEGLKENIAEDKREKYLDVILSEAERTDGMVLEMLDLSRLEAGKVKLSRDDFSITEMILSTFERLGKVAQGKGLSITYNMPENLIITADEGRLGQVIENFASNAVKYTPEGGNILVTVTPNGAGVTVAVENDSPPLSPEALTKVWDAFYRTDDARSGGGTGLGLTIAKSIVELHGGKCSVRNTGTGVEFSFII